MVKNNQLETANADNAELLNLLPRIMLFPGEDKTTFEALRESLTGSIAPQTPYEAAIAENLVTLEWEAIRNRNMRDSLIRGEFRELAIGVFQRHEITKVYKYEQETEAQEYANDLFSTDLEQRDIAERELEDIGISPSEILADAYWRNARFVEVHEQLLADIEVRRRRLISDFYYLQSIRESKYGSGPMMLDK